MNDKRLQKFLWLSIQIRQIKRKRSEKTLVDISRQRSEVHRIKTVTRMSERGFPGCLESDDGFHVAKQ